MKEMAARVGQRFMQARGLKADYGDVPYYVNVFDIFRATGLPITRDTVEWLQGEIQDALLKNNSQIMTRVIRDLKRNRTLQELLFVHGAEFK